MGCGVTTVKVSSIVFNVILAILGVGAIIWIAINPEGLREQVAISAYIACSLVIVFAILGIYAAIRESVCLTATCAVFLLLLSILQIITIVMDLSDYNSRSGLVTVEKAWAANDMNDIQADHECCGRTSVQDYILLNQQIPPSCYRDRNVQDPTALFLDGCVAKMQAYYDAQAVRFAIVSWTLSAFEFIGFLLAVFLVINFRNTQRRMQF